MTADEIFIRQKEANRVINRTCDEFIKPLLDKVLDLTVMFLLENIYKDLTNGAISYYDFS
jgi:hypothetical protein